LLTPFLALPHRRRGGRKRVCLKRKKGGHRRRRRGDHGGLRQGGRDAGPTLRPGRAPMFVSTHCGGAKILTNNAAAEIAAE
jgi:hypothetical protein